MAKIKGSGHKIICRNKRARFDYKINEVYEAGMVLTGTEVKSLRQGRANLTDSYARVIDGEVWMFNSHISPYPFAHHENHDPERRRKLLLHKREIKKLYGRTQEKGMTLIPLSIYFKDGKAKVDLGLAVGKQVYDKRQVIKKRMADREMARALRQGREEV
ncbi:MAG: SsrA-binding protein SmpB [Deltaproteobacteria bacterium]|nr:SsrA-binding protein SmpB [Deltaproteobacteria bacterium]MBW2085648.1 SsrA-binding protein SmpB [Deltaproteobacteria bacterium]